MSNTLYEQDFYAWANEQARLLRAGRLTDADIEHIAEELESLGKTEKRELVRRLKLLLTHLLKWQYQPTHRGASSQATIRVQRRELARHMADNPSLKAVFPQSLAEGYGDATIEAAAETGLLESTFPVVCPWSDAQFMDPDFWPDQTH